MKDSHVIPDGDDDIVEENGDERHEDIDEVEGEAAAADKIKKLRQDLKKCQSERGEYLAGWQRAKADFVNREREAREMAERAAASSRERLLEDLLPVLDGFDMAVAAPSWQNVDASWRSGMEALRKQLEGALAKNGIEAFDPKGATFDPSEHEAVETAPAASENEDHTVLAVHQKGYRINGRVLRAARVKIGIWQAPK